MERIVRTLVLSLIGNPVKIGDGPAAVTPHFYRFICNETLRKRNPFSHVCHFSCRNGKAAERAGKSEDLSGQTARPLKNAHFCSSSRKAKILSTGIH
jgi:hypothetical protein